MKRFDYHHNLSSTTNYDNYKNQFWPPSESWVALSMDLSDFAPARSELNYQELTVLRHIVELELSNSRTFGRKKRGEYYLADEFSNSLAKLADSLSGDDRKALEIRASAIIGSYDDDALEELVSLRPRISIVSGNISTWYGKEIAGRPTSFAAVVDPVSNAAVGQADEGVNYLVDYVHSLDNSLTIKEVPNFESTNLFFMAGEGNLHPKHFAYFVPEDEGVKYSPFKQTYYFNNVHNFLFEKVSKPLYLDIVGRGDGAIDEVDRIVPAIWMRGHDYGHCVTKSENQFSEINTLDRWASVALQEATADVFGTLFLIGPWSKDLSYSRQQATAYYVAELLRYIHRGIGIFPDSDGMYFQLSYLTLNGYTNLETHSGKVHLEYTVDSLERGLQALGRELSYALLGGDGKRASEFFRRYGPKSENLSDLVQMLAKSPPYSVNYLQEHC